MFDSLDFPCFWFVVLITFGAWVRPWLLGLLFCFVWIVLICSLFPLDFILLI